jgi:hypothetical protein
MHRLALPCAWAIVASAISVAACSRQESTPDCVADVRYSTARSAPPVQIPDDLSPPNESDALRLPPDAGTTAGTRSADGSCLESPPSFFGDSRPFRRSAEEDETDRDEEEPAEPPAAGGDRVIDN